MLLSQDFHPSKLTKVWGPGAAIILIFIFILGSFILYQRQRSYQSQMQSLEVLLADTRQQLSTSKNELNDLKNQDQYKINQELTGEIKNIHDYFGQAVSLYEGFLDLKSGQKNKMDELFASSLRQLSNRNYASAAASLASLNKIITDEKAKAATTPVSPTVITENKPPSAGYRRQLVETPNGKFVVDIISADLNSTRVIIDTASDSDCTNNCPVMSLANYASRSGAFAAINGSFFCPAEYPSCSGKTNSFDTLLMNKNKRYFNSDNNVYSVIPVAVFQGSSARFISQSLQWGRDTSVDAVIANYPLLLLGGNPAFSGSPEEKINSKGNRCFIGINGSLVYIGVVHSATTAEEVSVLKTLGLQDALGLDQGGSTALWYQGSYKIGPGRNIPNAILFTKK